MFAVPILHGKTLKAPREWRGIKLRRVHMTLQIVGLELDVSNLRLRDREPIPPVPTLPPSEEEDLL